MLKANNTYSVLGVMVNESIIPDGTRWQNESKAIKAGFSAKSLYKSEKKLCGETGKVEYITVHNTNDIDNVNDDAEQYVRATYNENMGSVRVHFYVDDLGAWQMLKAGTGMSPNDSCTSAEVSWHAGDGEIFDGGNMTSLSVEIIMNDTKEHDILARDNGARLVAWLLWKHSLSIDRVVTHTYWVNKKAGNVFEDADVQSTNYVAKKKWCPAYILGDKKTSFESWKKFKDEVEKHFDSLNNNRLQAQEKNTTIKEDMLVSLTDNAVYYTGKSIPKWVKNQNWYVKSVNGDRAVLDENESRNNRINSPINTKYLKPIKKATAQIVEKISYKVKVISDRQTVYDSVKEGKHVVAWITDNGVYTIVEEAKDLYGKRWGKLKSGLGWILLDDVVKL